MWRHGQTDYNIEGRVQGIVDVALNDRGLGQAQRAAHVLGQTYQPVTIVSSDLERARQTAQALGDVVDQEVRVDERARERAFGKLEGLTSKEMRARYEDYYEQWRATGECPAAGIEARRSVGARVADLIREECERAEAGRTLVVVSHGSALTQGLVTLMGLDPGTWAGIRGLDNCHWAEIAQAQRAPGWRIHAYNRGADR
nr:histidine phosphatase family protein [Nanchangia anserum]